MQYSTSIMEIDRREIIAIFYFSRLQTERVDRLHPVELFLLIGCAPGDVVNGSRTRTTNRHLTMYDINDISKLPFRNVPVNGLRPFTEGEP